MDSKQIPKTPSPHDQFFKGMFSQAEIAIEYIRNFLPNEIWQNLQLEQLSLDGTSYVTSELKTYFSDLVWQCPYQNTQINIAFLFEHKTSQPKYVHIQLLRYMLQIWEQDIKDKRQHLRPVIPIIVYQGLKKWKIRPMTDSYPAIDDALKKYLPDFEYELNDLNRITEDDMLKLDSKKLTLALYSMAKCRSLLQNLEQLDQIFLVFDGYENTEENTNFVDTIIVYLMRSNKIKSNEMKQLLEKTKSKTMQRAKSTYDQIIDEGIKIGLEKGIEKGIELAILKAHKSGQSVEFIASMFEISVDKVKRVIEQHR